jgi:hypothetical protein
LATTEAAVSSQLVSIPRMIISSFIAKMIA